MTESYATTVSVDGKDAVVVGGTSGIGRAIAHAFAEDGADVIATSRDPDRVAETAAELRDRGATTTEISTDVRDPTDVDALCDAAFDALDNVDILVNSAGTVSRATVTDAKDTDWDRDLDVNLSGVFRTVRAFANRMDDGAIVNISSMSAWQNRERRPGYCAAKSGVNGLTRAAAADLGPDIRVNAIAPGFVQTPITDGAFDEGTAKREQIDDRTPQARIAQPEEIAGAAIYLASDAASFTTGEVLTVDGGYHASAI